MTPEVTAFRWVPSFAQGYVRDLRVRWALEEAGIPYEAHLVDGATLRSEPYRAWQPFAQVPAYRDGAVTLFESGAIVLYLAGKSEALAPPNEAGKARVTTWVMAALNSIEPHAQNFLQLSADATPEMQSQLEAMLIERLTGLSDWFGDKLYLEDRFTAADLIMTTVLRELVDSGVLARFPNLAAYRERCEARPAFGRAMEAQLKPFRENAPA